MQKQKKKKELEAETVGKSGGCCLHVYCHSVTLFSFNVTKYEQRNPHRRSRETGRKHLTNGNNVLYGVEPQIHIVSQRESDFGRGLSTSVARCEKLKLVTQVPAAPSQPNRLGSSRTRLNSATLNIVAIGRFPSCHLTLRKQKKKKKLSRAARDTIDTFRKRKPGCSQLVAPLEGLRRWPCRSCRLGPFTGPYPRLCE